MRFVCNYANLLSNLSDLSEVVDNGLASDDLKNVIFKMTNDTVELVGVNQFIIFFRELDKQYYTLELEDGELDEKGVKFMQLRSKEVRDFLSAYKSIRRTSVEDVVFESMPNSRVKCSVIEKNLEDGRTNTSSWLFTEIPLKPNILNQINVNKPDAEIEKIESHKIMFYTRNLLPLLQTGTTLYSRLVFAEDYVVVFTQSHATFMRNILCDYLKGIYLSQRAVSFMDKVLCQSDIVGVSRDDNHLYFETENSRAYLLYSNKLPAYEAYVKAFVRDKAFSVDRIYLQDTLKRLKLLNESVEFTIDGENSEMTLKNTKFVQQIPLLQVKALDEIFHFKVLPDVLSKVIVGSDDDFSQTLYVYYCPQGNKNALLVFTDDSGSWFSSITVKPY